jgi:hypothetical protein
MDQDFFGKHAFQRGNELKVQYQITFVNEGSRALRWLAGWGAGKGKVTVQTTFFDPTGKQIATFAIDGDVVGGMAGGSIFSAAEDCADQISDYATDNYLANPSSSAAQAPSSATSPPVQSAKGRAGSH